jgi:hypothetical protein
VGAIPPGSDECPLARHNCLAPAQTLVCILRYYLTNLATYIGAAGPSGGGYGPATSADDSHWKSSFRLIVVRLIALGGLVGSAMVIQSVGIAALLGVSNACQRPPGMIIRHFRMPYPINPPANYATSGHAL